MSRLAPNPTTDESNDRPQETHVLEFDLGEERFCVEIGYIAEIVNTKRLRTIPNTPPHIEGVMDLRGETTKIVNLKTIFDIDGEFGDRIIVFKRKRGSNERIGWLADEVHQVREIRTDAVDQSVAGEGITGIVRREDDDEFVVWIDPTSVTV
ncbi:chemotaxis protein CheW [Natrialbaceae archaeon GCM10025810]|uniref:chemotaxis protein CheW n=1 Tax=Halovalidus salilacus TaxID=3075124 RepID=UPI003607812B